MKLTRFTGSYVDSDNTSSDQLEDLGRVTVKVNGKMAKIHSGLTGRTLHMLCNYSGLDPHGKHAERQYCN